MKNGIVIAGTQSGVGKTTLTIGIMAALKKRGLSVQGFKVGPDYLDPTYHRLVTGRPSHNLDGWMTDKGFVSSLYERSCETADFSVVEGAMGLFDGYGATSEEGSAAQIAKWLGLPVVLVVNAKGMSRSAVALVKGYLEFDPELRIAGVLFNNLGSKNHLDILREAVESALPVKVLGGLLRNDSLAMPERHLGLATADENVLNDEFLGTLAQNIEQFVDLDELLKMAGCHSEHFFVPKSPFEGGGFECNEKPGDVRAEPSVRPLVPKHPPVSASLRPPPSKEESKTMVRPFGKACPELNPLRKKIGVAFDDAFHFYYQANLDLLREAGADIRFFSPLRDTELPEGIEALYLGGGYPELFAKELSGNQRMLGAIKAFAEAGNPVYAECGGLMYLGTSLINLEGEEFALASVFPYSCRMLPKRKALGYVEVVLERDSVIGRKGDVFRGHEFHYSEIADERSLENIERDYRLKKRSGGNDRLEGYRFKNVLASYVHLHFASHPQLAENFLKKA